MKPPSASAETAFLLRAAMVILLCAVGVIALERPRDAGRRSLMAGEVAFGDLGSPDQRMVRALGEGGLEAESLRSRTGAWPSVETLAAEGIPPFAADPLDRGGYTWALLKDGQLVNYVGTPRSGTDRKGFVVLIVEPEPGTAVDPSVPSDDTHHRLQDGTMLHVTLWTGPPVGPLSQPLNPPPLERGWAQIVIERP